MEQRLQPFPQSGGRPLSWWQPTPGIDQYELRLGAGRLATLAWPSARDPLAYAETSAGAWLLVCKQGQVRALTSARRATAGRFEFGWDGGVLYLADGETFHWGCNAALGRSEWVESGVILRATYDLRPGGAGGQVTLAPGAAQLPALPLLAIFDRYLMHLLVNEYLATQQPGQPAALRLPTRAPVPAQALRHPA